MIFLALFACLAVAIATASDTNLTVARNRIASQQAAALAETGIQLTQRTLGGLSVPSCTTATSLHAAIADCLEQAWQSSNMIDTDAIASNASGVTLPSIALTAAGGRITLLIQASGGTTDNTTITIRSTGACGQATRTATYNMTVQRGQTVLSNYGLASKSAITMTGNARIRGLNDPSEGSVLVGTYSTNQALKMTGNCNISGNVDINNPNGQVTRTGNCSIGGTTTIGAAESEWPQVDVSIFRPYATNVRSTGGSGTLTLSNIRIPAGSNPTFSGNVTIRGVVYVESPNKVTFSGNANLTGLVVCEPPTVNNLTANQIKFTGNLTTSGVENLPAESQYDGLRDLTGTFLLAPGYSTQFTGNFSTVNGCMVASEFKFTGNAGGTIRGGIVNLADSSFQITGNANLAIDRQNAVANPAGLSSPYRLVCVSGSYAE